MLKWVESADEYIQTSPISTPGRPPDIISYTVWFYFRFNLSHRDIDEVLVKINGKQRYLWRAVDQDGEVVDVYLQAKRDAATAKRFFKRLLHSFFGARGIPGWVKSLCDLPYSYFACQFKGPGFKLIKHEYSCAEGKRNVTHRHSSVGSGACIANKDFDTASRYRD